MIRVNRVQYEIDCIYSPSYFKGITHQQILGEKLISSFLLSREWNKKEKMGLMAELLLSSSTSTLNAKYSATMTSVFPFKVSLACICLATTITGSHPGTGAVCVVLQELFESVIFHAKT